jgi:hypothetical protein
LFKKEKRTMPQPEPMNWPVKLQISRDIAEEMDKTPALGKPINNVSFRFDLLGSTFQCQTREGQNGPMIQMAAEIGKIPYTAENSLLRRQVLDVINETKSLTHCRLAVSAHQAIYCIGKAPLARENNPIDLCALVCCLTMESLPYLRRIAEILPRTHH